MRKLVFNVVAVLLLTLQFGYAQQGASGSLVNDFRTTKWGMNKNQVLALEYADLKVNNPNLLTYDGAVAGFPAYIDYIFTGGKLSEGGYKFHQEHENHDVYLEDYRSLKALLTEKYGQPDADTEEWLFNQYKDQPELRGKAMARGHLTFSTSWSTENTLVTMSLKGKDYAVSFDLNYKTLNLKKEMDRIKQKQKLNGL